jgi:hypothetical protein
MIAVPSQVQPSGTSPHTAQPKPAITTSRKYWNGATALASPAFSASVSSQMIPGVNSAKPARIAASPSPSGRHATTAKGRAQRLVTIPTQATTVRVSSVRDSIREVSVMPHQVSAAPSATSTPASGRSVPGRSITATPASPAIVPTQRAAPTRSPSTGRARMVVHITLVKDSTVAAARLR